MSNDNTKLYTVYRLYNNKTGNSYVGMTVQKLKARLREHKSKLARAIHPSSGMQKDFDNYGWEPFCIEPLESNLPKKQAKAREGYYILHFDCANGGYNTHSKGGEGVAKKCKWNGIEYPSVLAAAKALGINDGTMQDRLDRGHTCDDDIQYSSDPVACEWDGVTYPSIHAAAAALRISVNAMHVRVKKGYKCDADMNRGRRSVYWNGIEYASVKDAAKANGIASCTMSYRLKQSYTCDADLKKNQYG